MISTPEAPQETSQVSLDLHAISTCYSGRARIDRLIFISTHSTLTLSQEAKQLAILYIQQDTFDTKRYHALCSTESDINWINTCNRRSKDTLDRLETELKSYKNNHIKESIRMAYSDLADHYFQIGDALNSIRSYTRARDYATTSQQCLDICMNMIKVSFANNALNQVPAFINKAELLLDVPEKDVIQSKLKAASGIVNLVSKNYKNAAICFVSVGFNLGNTYNEIVSCGDVALYGGLCALASFDRSELKTKIFENIEFREFMELEPIVCEIMTCYLECKYSECLGYLEKHKNEWLLDMYLHDHVDILIEKIRMKLIVQYFEAFMSADLIKMASIFRVSVSVMEKQLVDLIEQKLVIARIDSKNKIIKTVECDEREQLFNKCVENANERRLETERILIRMKMIKAGIIVKSNTGSIGE